MFFLEKLATVNYDENLSTHWLNVKAVLALSTLIKFISICFHDQVKIDLKWSYAFARQANTPTRDFSVIC